MNSLLRSASTRRAMSLGSLLLMLSVLLTACGGDTDSSDSSGEGGEGAQLVQLSVSTHEFKFDVASPISAGLVEITLTNEGEKPHQVQLFRLNEGVEFSKFKKVVTTDEEGGVFALAVVAGGVTELAPGGTATVTDELQEGSYGLVCFVQGHAFRGMVAPLEIGPAEETDFAQPESAGDITLADFQISIPDDFSGQGAFTVTNAGPSPHEAGLFKIDASLEDLEKYLEKPKGPPPGGEPEGLGGAAAIMPGDSMFLPLNLEPGTYAFVCFVPDQKTGKPHFELGMATPFEIQ